MESLIMSSRKRLAANLTESLARWVSGRCIWQNSYRLRTHSWKWTAQKMPFTDKCFKKPALSVNPHHNGQKFTDKSSKIGSLSVNLSEILDWSVEKSYSQIDCIVRHLIYFKRKTGLFTGLILAKNHIMTGLSLSSRPQKWAWHENVLFDEKRLRNKSC